MHNPWKLNPDNYTLELFSPSDTHWVYYVDLETCTSSAKVLDWIFQISGRYMDIPEDEVTTGLIKLLNAILYPQSTLCSMGKDKRLTREQIRKLVDNYVKLGAWYER